MLRALLLVATAGAAWAVWRRPRNPSLATSRTPSLGATVPETLWTPDAPSTPHAGERVQQTHEGGANAGIAVEGLESGDMPLTGAPAVQDAPILLGVRDQFRGA